MNDYFYLKKYINNLIFTNYAKNEVPKLQSPLIKLVDSD